MARPISKKTDIETAAIKLFSRKGLAATTLKDIALEAGATEGALYRHYKSKNSMAWQLFSQELKTFTDLLLPILQGKAEFSDRLADAIRYIYRYYAQHPDRFSFILLSQHNFPEQAIRDEKNNPNDMAINFIRQGITEGVIADQDPILLAGLLMGAILQPLIMQRYGRLVINNQTVELVTNACQRLVGCI